MTANEIIQQDATNLKAQLCGFDPSVLSGKRILITGATGLIGYNLIRTLATWSVPVKIIALVRNRQKADRLFTDLKNLDISYIVSDIADPFALTGPLDYLIHAANQTSSKAFVDEPVETITTAIEGTRNMLELARQKGVRSFVYLSSMEIYGAPQTDDKIYETHSANIDTMTTRSSYPESKRMCESLCRAYYAEYNVPVKVIRLSQTFGPGISYGDNRVPAEFARCAIEKKDIVLHTDGQTRRSYLYTADAVSAILTILFHGQSGEAYNATNERTYCSILDMAELVATKCSNSSISVKIQIEDPEKFGFAPRLCMNLSTEKLQKVGWTPLYSLEEAFRRMISCMKEASPNIVQQ